MGAWWPLSQRRRQRGRVGDRARSGTVAPPPRGATLRTLYAPWYWATSSPMTKTFSSLCISSRTAELSASRTVSCEVRCESSLGGRRSVGGRRRAGDGQAASYAISEAGWSLGRRALHLRFAAHRAHAQRRAARGPRARAQYPCQHFAQIVGGLKDATWPQRSSETNIQKIQFFFKGITCGERFRGYLMM
jgi:hypothetical protein